MITFDIGYERLLIKYTQRIFTISNLPSALEYYCSSFFSIFTHL